MGFFSSPLSGRMKTKVSKKAIGIFVASAVVLLLVVFMMSEPTRVAMATRASQCKVRPETASISTGTDVPFPQPVFGGREDVTPPRPPVPPTPNPPNPPIVIGGGGASPWGLNPYLTPLPISTQSPIAGQWSPLATPPYKPPIGGHPPNPIACELGHEGESTLSANTTVEMDTDPPIAKKRYDEDKRRLYRAWDFLRDNAVGVSQGIRSTVLLDQDDDDLATRLVNEFFEERRRVDTIFELTDGNYDPADFSALLFHLDNFKWLPKDADKLNKVRIDMGVGNVIVYVKAPSRFFDEVDMI